MIDYGTPVGPIDAALIKFRQAYIDRWKTLPVEWQIRDNTQVSAYVAALDDAIQVVRLTVAQLEARRPCPES